MPDLRSRRPRHLDLPSHRCRVLQPAWGVWELFPQNASTDFGSYASVPTSRRCAATKPRSPIRQLLQPPADVPLFGPFLGHHADLEACDVWAVEPAPPAANEPVHSDVPFLVLAGDLDTVSSPAWADAFAEGLTAAQIVHFPGVGTQPTGGPTNDRADLCPPDPRPVPRRADHTRRRHLRRHVPRQARSSCRDLTSRTTAVGPVRPQVGTPPRTDRGRVRSRWSHFGTTREEAMNSSTRSRRVAIAAGVVMLTVAGGGSVASGHHRAVGW